MPGYFDVGDRCWRRDMSVTSIRCLTILAILVTNTLSFSHCRRALTFKRFHQHRIWVINITFTRTSRSWSRKRYIDVGDGCFWRMLEMKCVSDNFEILVTVLAVVVTNILYFFTLATGSNIITNIKIPSPTPKIITKIKSSTSTCDQHLCSPRKLQTYLWFFVSK